MRAVKTVAVHDKIPLRSIIRLTKFRNLPDHLDSLEALKAELIRQRPEYADRPKHEIMNAIRNGLVAGAEPVSVNEDDNLLLRGFYQNIFAALAGDSSDIEIKYLALGLSYADTNFTQTTLGAEHYRDVPDETYEDGTRTFYATLYLKKSEGNPPSTTLTAGTSNTVTLTDVTDFVENGRIQIETDNATYNCTVTDITGSVLTVGSITGNGLVGAAAFPDGDTPVSGNTCKALISEGAIIVGSDATSTLETGTPLNRRRVEEEKTTSDSLLFDYILSGTSVEV